MALRGRTAKLDVRLQPKQCQLYDLLAAIGPRVATTIGGGGAKGGGKSDGARGCALQLGAEFGANYPGFTITIVRRVYDDLKKNHIDPILRKYPDLMYFYNAANREIDLGSYRIVFMYAETEDDVKRKFLGGYESAIIIVDEAQQFSQEELMWISTAARWTDAKFGIPEGMCKTLLLFNPGGKGSEYIRRIFWIKEYKSNETPHSYAFVHIFGWDNYEWFRGQVDIEEEDFYALDSDTRFQMFITQTSEGRKYNAFPESIRLGYLLGSFDHFAGQYFAGVWSERTHVLSLDEIHRLRPYWWTTWMGGDWGFGHYWSTFWAVIGRVEPSLALDVLGIDTPWPLDIVIVYRELLPGRRGADGQIEPETRWAEVDVANLIVHATPKRERKEIVRWVMGADVNQKPRFSQHTYLEMIEGVTVPAGFPRIHNAQCGPGSRVVNARILYEMLRRTTSMRSDNPPQDKPDGKTFPLIFFSCECPRICSALPLLQADPDNPEDVLKVDGLNDDLYDGLKYLTAEYASVREIAPVEVRREEAINRGSSMQAKYLNQLRFDAEESQSSRRMRRR